MKKLVVAVVAMKKLAVAVVALIVMMTGSVALADTNTLTVNGTVTGTCKFVTATSTLSFTLDPSLATDATATTSPTFWCTKGAAYTATSGQGSNYSTKNRMKGLTTLTEFIPYSLVLSPASGSGTGKNTPITLLVTGTVSNADYVDVAAQNYSDTVVLTVLP
jgi:hypothetical protein